MWKLNWKMSKEKWLLLLICGVILLILSFPSGGKNGNKSEAKGKGFVQSVYSDSEDKKDAEISEVSSSKSKGGNYEEREYEKMLEQRVKDILKNVQGVGEVDVMITLKSSKEKVLHVDKDKSRSLTEETDSAGGNRKSSTEEIKETALMTGNSSGGEPVIEKEMQPQIAGIVISAQGGGSGSVKAEISQAMEALFDLPAHKIKVLKRVE